MRKLFAALGLVVAGVMTALFIMTNHSYVTTPSMYPTIPPGSMIIVSHKRHYHVGEVIEFRANNLVWAHRLIKIDNDGQFHTKGDNPQNSPDVFTKPLTQTAVIGAVTYAPRWIGFPELIAHHPRYGLSWLRAELGLTGKIGLIAAVGALTLFASGGRTRRGKPQPPSPVSHDSAGASYPPADSRSQRDDTHVPDEIRAFVSDPQAVLVYAMAVERSQRAAADERRRRVLAAQRVYAAVTTPAVIDLTLVAGAHSEA